MNDKQIAVGALYDPVLVRERFIETLGQSFRNLAADGSVHVRGRLIKILGEWNPAFLASPDMLETINQEVFTDVVFRDWMFSFKFIFFMNVGSGVVKGILASLVEDLTLAASEDMQLSEGLDGDALKVVAEAIVMAEELVQDLPNAAQVQTVITGNSWLVVLLLLFAYVDMDHPVLKTPVVPVGKGPATQAP